MSAGDCPFFVSKQVFIFKKTQKTISKNNTKTDALTLEMIFCETKYTFLLEFLHDIMCFDQVYP